MPTQLRRPVAKVRRFLPSGSNASTSARSSSEPQGAPRPCFFSHSASGSGGFGPISSATFEAEPIDRNIVLPSAENTSVRDEWLPVSAVSFGTTVSGSALATRSPFLYGKRTIEFTFATYRYRGFGPAGQNAKPNGRSSFAAN